MGKNLEKEYLRRVQRFVELGRISTALFHDLANQLTSVSLDVAFLDNNYDKTLVRRIQNNIEYINDVVQRVGVQMLSKDDNTQVRFDVVFEIAEIIKLLTLKAKENRVTISFNIPEDDILLLGDPTRFRQIVINLMCNAIDACAGCSEAKRTVIIDIAELNKKLQINVVDRGKGIAMDHIKCIFEPFFTLKQNGTGIGLFIVKQVVEQDFGGNITVQSNPKTGTKFTVNIPMGKK
jgi:signal transduction histidine kinase